MYFSGQGRVLVAVRDAVTGKPGPFRYVGNCPELKVALGTDTIEHQESTSGQRLTDLRLVKAVKASLSLTLEEFDVDNLSMALYGAKATIAGAAVVDEVLPDALAVGDYVRLVNPKVSALTFKDSTPVTPKVPVLGTHLSLDSSDHGTLKVLDITTAPGPFAQPFKASYTYGTVKNVTMFKDVSKERWIRFEGMNTANSNSKVLVELYRVQTDPLKDLSVLTDDFLKMSLDGTVLYDAINNPDAKLGGFGRVVDLA